MEDEMTATIREIADFLGQPLRGEASGASDLRLEWVATIAAPKPRHLHFAERADDATIARLDRGVDWLVIAGPSLEGRLRCPHVISQAPRFDYARAVRRFFAPPTAPAIAPTARIGHGVVIGERVSIGEYCVIADGVEIGDDTMIQHHVTIGPRVRIGRGCRIKSSAVIGEEGFGVEYDAEGKTYLLPQIGGVVIGDHVMVGSLTTVVGGTIEPTRIDDYAAVDDHVHVGHNVKVGRGAVVTACCEISGSTVIGAYVYLAPNITIRESLTIGDRTMIGLGAVVLKDVPADRIMIGKQVLTREEYEARPVKSGPPRLWSAGQADRE
jgi:UDP-3-O-[3-hydroxymyristoyl] glucosamine N-acyltransferase LpxD